MVLTKEELDTLIFNLDRASPKQLADIFNHTSRKYAKVWCGNDKK